MDGTTMALAPVNLNSVAVTGRSWSDDEGFLGLMRVRGVQRRARYAEPFTVEESELDSGTGYSVNEQVDGERGNMPCR